MAHKITIVCDSCEKEYMIESTMDLPPYWLGVQMAIADKDGVVPPKDIFIHLCSQECMADYAASDIMKEKILLADKHERDFREEEDDEDDIGER